jgi:hypothetical protein
MQRASENANHRLSPLGVPIRRVRLSATRKIIKT